MHRLCIGPYFEKHLLVAQEGVEAGTNIHYIFITIVNTERSVLQQINMKGSHPPLARYHQFMMGKPARYSLELRTSGSCLCDWESAQQFVAFFYLLSAGYSWPGLELLLSALRNLRSRSTRRMPMACMSHVQKWYASAPKNNVLAGKTESAEAF